MRIESDNHQIHEVRVHIPHRKIFGLIAITLMLQAIGTLAVAYSVDKTNAAQLVDIGTTLSIAVFICGALMWGRFPSADESLVDHVDKDRSPQDMREMSITNMIGVRCSDRRHSTPETACPIPDIETSPG